MSKNGLILSPDDTEPRIEVQPPTPDTADGSYHGLTTMSTVADRWQAVVTFNDIVSIPLLSKILHSANDVGFETVTPPCDYVAGLAV